MTSDKLTKTQCSSPVSEYEYEYEEDDDDAPIQIQLTHSPSEISLGASADAGANDQDKKKAMALYVGDLAPEVTEAMLYKHFGDCGHISSIKVCRDATTGKSLCYAYVNFTSQRAGERALDEYNFTHIMGKPCRIVKALSDMSSSNNSNIYIRNLDASFDSKKLMDTFSMFGPVLSCKVVENTGRGYVQFETQQSATEAVVQTNGTVLGGSTTRVQVDHFVSKSERSMQQTASLFIRGIPRDVTDSQITELFSGFGAVKSVYLPCNKNGKIGWGYVNYEQPDMAHMARMFMDGFLITDSTALQIVMSNNEHSNDQVLTEQGSCCVLIKTKPPVMLTSAMLLARVAKVSSPHAAVVTIIDDHKAFIKLQTAQDALNLVYYLKNPARQILLSVTLLPVTSSSSAGPEKPNVTVHHPTHFQDTTTTTPSIDNSNPSAMAPFYYYYYYPRA